VFSNSQFSNSQVSNIHVSIPVSTSQVSIPVRNSPVSNSPVSTSPVTTRQLHTELPIASSDSIIQPESLSQPDEDAIIEQIATAEFLVGCGQTDRAFAQLRERLHDRPDHILIREKLKTSI